MLHEIFYYSFLHNSIINYLICAATFLLGIILIRVVKRIFLKALNTWVERASIKLDEFWLEVIENRLQPLLYLGVFYLGFRGLSVNYTLNKGINILGLIFLTIFGGRLLLEIIIYLIRNYWASKESSTANKHALYAVITIIRVIFWGLAVIILLDNLGIKISALLTGLGIGGIAIAFAAQAILVDMFSYVTIFFDRPFEIGDLIIVEDYVGTVEHIGIKTTRIRSLGGEELIFSNTDLTNSRVRNYKRMNQRRVVFKLGVTYETKLQKLKEIPLIIEEIIQEVRGVVFDRTHFFSYGDFSLDFEVVYYINGNDYDKYMDIRQEINYRIKEEFEKWGIEFAYPTQTLLVSKRQ